MERVPGVAERLAQLVERLRILVVAVDVLQALGEGGEGLGVDAAAVLLDALLGAGAQLGHVPSGLGDADDGHVEPAAPGERLESGKDHLQRQVAGGAEEDERVGDSGRGGHRRRL